MTAPVWKSKGTSCSVDVEIDEFSEEQMLQGLIDAGWISKEEAAAIKARGGKLENRVSLGTVASENDDLYRAKTAIARGDKSEALHYIEYHLGRDWIGVLQ